jgi:hypothetical protein
LFFGPSLFLCVNLLYIVCASLQQLQVDGDHAISVLGFC